MGELRISNFWEIELSFIVIFLWYAFSYCLDRESLSLCLDSFLGNENHDDSLCGKRKED